MTGHYPRRIAPFGNPRIEACLQLPVAYPKGQQFRWTMLNLGKVHIKGIDVEAEADFQIGWKVRS